MRYREIHKYRFELLDPERVQTVIVGFDIDTDYIRLRPDGKLLIKPRYAWDGASGPTKQTPDTKRGSLFHDALYQLMREGLLDRKKYRIYADELLRKICLEDGMSKGRADNFYWAVRHFGQNSTKPEKNPRGKIVTI
jgi:hypothetical protein